jgi:LmbE family N-acetylglucosaminyl deacetylase
VLKTKFLILFLSCCCLAPLFRGQTQELTIDRGAMGLAQALARLPLTSRVMFIAAHPDDENEGVLTYVSRGLHAKTALLTLTRGEGGQNLVSADLFDALGLLRTGELLAADEYYGVRQFFTRAFDFGFSKSSTETLQKWGPEVVLGDTVRAIRKFRPNVIISFYQGNAHDGHGQHQAAGILAREAYKLAGDPQRFPELLREGLIPWQAQRFYVGNLEEKEPFTLAVNTGEYLPLLGASYEQIGAQGYRSHRTQGMGNRYAAPGDYLVRYRLVLPPVEDNRGPLNRPAGANPKPETRGSNPNPDVGFLDPHEFELPKLSDLLKPDDPQRLWLERELNSLSTLVGEAQNRFLPSDFSGTYDPLLKGLTKLQEIRQTLAANDLGSWPPDHLQFLLADKEQDFLEAIEMATGLSFEALADDALITPGQSFTVTASVVNRSSVALNLRQLRLQAERGWKVEQTEGSVKSLSPQEKIALKFKVTVPPGATLTQPYWKRNSRRDTVYTVSQEQLINTPLTPPVMRATLDYSFSGSGTVPAPTDPSAHAREHNNISSANLSKEQAVEFLDSDPLRGTRHIPILVVPALGMEVTPPLYLIPLASSTLQRPVQVKLTNNARSPIAGSLRLNVPVGWDLESERHLFSIDKEGGAETFKFQVAARGQVRPGRTSFGAVASVNGTDSQQSFQIISAFSLWINPLYAKAESEVVTLDVKTPPNLSVGYIMGTGDKIPETLLQLGIRVTLLEAEDLAGVDLSQYPCIIAGVRAYDVRGDLIANNSRLLDYVKNGGVYTVQYNTPSAWNKSQYAPYPAKIRSANDRVTDETAPVKILDPQNPVFNFPNKITERDFDHWVQERGLYFIQERDSRFKPLLSTSDPGEPPLDGGLLIARYGKGRYVLTSYSWFRQLPEGVPGAVRIFANLISLAEAQRRGE